MGEVVHGVGIPLVTCTDMGDVQHTVDQRITEEHIRMCHIDLGTEYEGAWLTLATVHEVEELQVLLDRTVTERTVGTWTGCRSLLLSNDLRTLLIHISPALFDQPYGKIPEFLEVVAGIIDVSPLEPQPLDVILDALDILCIFLDGVGIVETEVTDTTVFLGQAEVDGNGLRMF